MYQSLCKDILALHDSIRFVAVVDSMGTIIADQYRDGLNPLMNDEETARYSIQAVTRVAMREDFTPKLGPFEYSIGKYEKLIRAVIPIHPTNEGRYLLLSFDVGSDAVGIIENKILRSFRGDRPSIQSTENEQDKLGLMD